MRGWFVHGLDSMAPFALLHLQLHAALQHVASSVAFTQAGHELVATTKLFLPLQHLPSQLSAMLMSALLL